VSKLRAKLFQIITFCEACEVAPVGLADGLIRLSVTPGRWIIVATWWTVGAAQKLRLPTATASPAATIGVKNMD
jgi:hypothetical protein